MAENTIDCLVLLFKLVRLTANQWLIITNVGKIEIRHAIFKDGVIPLDIINLSESMKRILNLILIIFYSCSRRFVIRT